MIYGIVGLVMLALFLALSAAPFLLVGAAASRMFGVPALRWMAPAVLAVAIGSWAMASYGTLKEECKAHHGIEGLAKLAERPSGIQIKGYREPSFDHGVAWQEALARGTFEFVEVEQRRYCREPNSSRYSTRCEELGDARSTLILEALPPRTPYWWIPSLAVREYVVREASTGRLMARASDVVFGGPVSGMYLRLLGGDQDYSRLSCGYASPEIGPYRPTLSGRPRMMQYQNADLQLLVKAFP
jgi:hypothetical protein